MPVTPNLAFLENAWPRQEDFTKQIKPTFCRDRALWWVLWEQLQSACWKIGAVFLQANAKM